MQRLSGIVLIVTHLGPLGQHQHSCWEVAEQNIVQRIVLTVVVVWDDALWLCSNLLLHWLNLTFIKTHHITRVAYYCVRPALVVFNRRDDSSKLASLFVVRVRARCLNSITNLVLKRCLAHLMSSIT